MIMTGLEEYNEHRRQLKDKRIRSEKLALETLEHMSGSAFRDFLATVPRLVHTRIENRTSDWRKVLPKYFIQYVENNS